MAAATSDADSNAFTIDLAYHVSFSVRGSDGSAELWSGHGDGAREVHSNDNKSTAQGPHALDL